jgi:serine/threonine protein kinase/WD40 repeat protein
VNESLIFNNALKFATPAERAAYLDKTCGANSQLRSEVEALLKVHGSDPDFLEAPAPSAAASPGQPLNERHSTKIGPYKLLQQIGEGGMGTVFMAEQMHPVQRKVALKVIKLGMDSRQVIARFEAERQALALMDHPNIAKVLDAGTTEAGRPYFVMELVNGVPITNYCDERQLTPRQRLELFLPVCQAVQHAHHKGIIHRDLKPSNVMVCIYDGKPVPKVIDFGVAKATGPRLTDQTLYTEFGAIVGTFEYMSPEQAELDQLDVDTRSDVYSLGVLMYELLTGTTPLERKRVKEVAILELLRLVREEEAPRLSTRLSTVEGLPSIAANRGTEPRKLSGLMRGELDWIVLKALEKDRNRRYDAANALAADVLHYLHDESVLACTPSVGYRLRKFARRNKSSLATLSLLALALIAGTVVSTWQALRATGAERLAQERLKAETEAQERATHRLYEARVAQAKAGSLSRRVGQRFDSLQALAEAVKIARELKLPEEILRLRNAAIACLTLPDMRLARQWPDWPAGSIHGDFDGDLESFARVDRQGAISIRRVADGSEIASLPGDGTETWPLLSRDGRFLAVRSQKDLRLWKLNGKTPVLLLNLSSDAYRGAAFSPDSRAFVAGRPEGTIRVYDLSSWQAPHELPGGRRPWNMAIDPEGRSIAVLCEDVVEVRDLATGKVISELRAPVKPKDALAWHPDGKTLAVVGVDGRVFLFDVPTGKPTVILEGIGNHGIEVAFNHAGDLIATTGWEGMLRLWDSHTGQQVFSTMSGILGSPPRFSRDDRWVSGDTRDGKLGLWEIAKGGEYRTLLHAHAEGELSYHSAAIHPDQRLLAVGMNGGFGIWDLATGGELAFVKRPGLNNLLFERSGSLVTNARTGVLRWPISSDSRLVPKASPGDSAEKVTKIGPPAVIPVPGSINYLGCSRDGKVLAVPQSLGGLLLREGHLDTPVRIAPDLDTRLIAISPDGRWAAAGSHFTAGVTIWDAKSGAFVKELPADNFVGFSPDNKWLAVATGGLRLWEIGSWREGPRISEASNFGYSPDGRLLAVETGYGVVRLLAPETLKEYARLEDPRQDRSGCLQFSPDSSQLVTTNNDSKAIHVWDLRTIREELAQMGLDWELPAYSPPGPNEAGSLRVELALGEVGAMVQAQVYGREGLGFVGSSRWDQAIGAFEKAIALDPKSADTHNALAWLLATCPELKLRDPKRAVMLATKAVELTPTEGNHWNTLGVSQYRSGEWKTAAASLEKSNELLKGSELSFNAYFLAMAHWQLGNKDEARKWNHRAVEWMKKHKPNDEELGRFKIEAEKLLELKK